VCFTAADIRDSYFRRYQLIAFPGGIGDSDSWHSILEPTQDVIRNQIERGKYYLGVCMGAYWAGPHYYNLLKGIDAVQYIKRPGAEVRRSFGTTTQVIWQGQTEQMFFYDGCSLLGRKRNFRVIAHYTNGDAAAIIQDQVGIIGPHPESDLYWYNRAHLKPDWHEYKHHKLLLNFANELLGR
jgi:glutamine amidotransferase-like uncharacterized protein